MDVPFLKDPKAFRPARLIEKNNRIAKEMANHIVPFGLGRKKCVGQHLAKMEIFLLFTSLMQRCCFSKADGDLTSAEPIVGVAFHPKPFRVVVRERNEHEQLEHEQLIFIFFKARNLLRMMCNIFSSFLFLTHHAIQMSLVMRKPFAICKQQRRRSACASAQTYQSLCYSLLR